MGNLRVNGDITKAQVDAMASDVGPFSALGIAGSNLEPDMWKYINAQQDTLAAAQQAQNVYSVPQGNWQANAPAMPSTTTLAQRARELFLKRMGTIRAEMKLLPADFLACHILGETVYMFYVFGGKEGVVKESIELFPSDQLITQFRLVLT